MMNKVLMAAQIDRDMAACHTACGSQHNVGILKVGMDGAVKDVNQSMLSILGHSRRQCIGQHAQELILDWWKLAALFRGVKKDVMAKQRNTKIRCSNGSVKVVSLSAYGTFCKGKLFELTCFIEEECDREENLKDVKSAALYKSSRSRLRLSLREARAFSSYAEELREEERNRLGQEIHDNLGGVLTYLRLDLTRLAKAIARGDVVSAPAALKNKIDTMVDAANQAIATVRRVGMELKPILLEQFGLGAAIDWQIKEFESRTGIRCRIQNKLTIERFDDKRAVLLFRIVQEALTNIARHANATEVKISLKNQQEETILTIEDNGIGIPAQVLMRNNSLGLIGMRERARLAGGELLYGSSTKRGTVLTISVPTQSLNQATVSRGFTQTLWS
jgi:PAS domain S-box-containing protein